MKIEKKKSYVEPSVIVLNVESENTFMSAGSFENGTNDPSGEDDDF